MGPHALNATCDRGPTFVLNAEYTTTGHVLHTSAQIPSFLDPTLMWDPESGVGFECHISGYPANRTSTRNARGKGNHTPEVSDPNSNALGFWTEALTNRTSQAILLSPSSLQLTTSASITTTQHQHEQHTQREQPFFFALGYPTDPGTGGGDTTMSLGLTTIQPPSHPPHTAGGGGTGTWGSFVICQDNQGHLCGSAQYFVPPYPHNTTKHHITATMCSKTPCNREMPRPCSVTAPMSAAALASLTTGPDFSCAMVPADPPDRGTLLHPNVVQGMQWSLGLQEGHGVAPMVLETGDHDFDYNLHLLGDVYNMWAGNIFGNSPASIVCLHEMSWFSMISKEVLLLLYLRRYIYIYMCVYIYILYVYIYIYMGAAGRSRFIPVLHVIFSCMLTCATIQQQRSLKWRVI